MSHHDCLTLWSTLWLQIAQSPRKCTVTVIDNHEITGLDLVQCTELVDTNSGIVNLIMKEYAYDGRGHSFHSTGQIEWYSNTVDDKSVQVGVHQRIITIDGYSMPFVCNGGLMYLELLGIPTDNLQTYPTIQFISPHEWDPSNRKISMIFPLVSYCRCVNNPSSS